MLPLFERSLSHFAKNSMRLITVLLIAKRLKHMNYLT